MTRSGLARSIFAAAALVVGLPAAWAGSGVSWSVNVQLPPIGVVVGTPRHLPPPVVYAPPPTVYYAPPPAVVYAPPPRVVYAPAPIGYAHPGYDGHRHDRGRWKDRDRDGIPDRYERRPGWVHAPYGPPPAVVYRGW